MNKDEYIFEGKFNSFNKDVLDAYLNFDDGSYIELNNDGVIKHYFLNKKQIKVFNIYISQLEKINIEIDETILKMILDEMNIIGVIQ